MKTASPEPGAGSREALGFSNVGTEALDDPDTPPALVERMLHDIARCNRWLGGAGAMRFGLAQLLTPADRGRTLTLFDVGTGAADLPCSAQRWAARRGVTLTPLALERIPAAAAIAARAGVPVMVACAGAMPLKAKSVDIVLVSQVAHHLDRDSVVRLFAECSVAARRGVVIADLHRRWWAAGGFRLAATALRLHPTTVADGVTSVRRGYGPEELRSMCVDAGARNAQVKATLGARLVAWWSTGTASPEP